MNGSVTVPMSIESSCRGLDTDGSCPQATAISTGGPSVPVPGFTANMDAPDMSLSTGSETRIDANFLTGNLETLKPLFW